MGGGGAAGPGGPLPPQLLMASPAQSGRKLSVEALAGMMDVLVMAGERPGTSVKGQAGDRRGEGTGRDRAAAAGLPGDLL